MNRGAIRLSNRDDITTCTSCQWRGGSEERVKVSEHYWRRKKKRETETETETDRHRQTDRKRPTDRDRETGLSLIHI